MDKPILSILMMISNKTDMVKSALDSLVPILEKMPAELILTDTGCSAEVRQLIEGYDARILDFVWCNDFAKARNVGLKAAKGEWFLVIDDDECFGEVEEVVEFFNSGEYKDYGTASVIVRNYHDWEGNSFTDFQNLRFFKIYDGIEYIYPIHEQVNIVKGMEKRLGSVINHYGYAYKNTEEMIKKKERNRKLLEQEYAENPYNLRLVLHYAGFLRDLDHRKTLDICKKVIDKSRSDSMESQIYNLIPTVIDMHYLLGEMDEAKANAEWFLKRNINPVLRAQVNGIMSQVYLSEDNYEAALNAAKKYYDLFSSRFVDRFRKYQNPLNLMAFEKMNFSKVVQAGMIAALKLDDDSIMKEWFDKLASDEFDMKCDFYDIKLIEQIAISYKNENSVTYDSAKYILESLCLNQNIKQIVVNAIFSAACTKDDLALFSSVEGNNIAISLAKIANDIAKNSNISLSADEFKELWTNNAVVYSKVKKYEMLEPIMENADVITSFVCELTYLLWDTGVDSLVSVCDKEDLGYVCDTLLYVSGDNQERLKSVVYAYNKKKVKDKTEYEKMLQIERTDTILAYAENIEDRVKTMYAPHVIDNFEDYLNDEEIFGLKVMQIVNYVKIGDFDAALEISKGMISSKTEYLECVKDIVKWINEMNIESKFDSEMKELALMIKNKIRELINNGNIMEAIETEKKLQLFYK